jgi:hypothetical protein
MNASFGWFLPAVAVVATVIAVWADDTFSLAIPAAVVALLAAGLLFVDAFLGREPVARSLEGGSAVREAGPLRTAFRSGRLGREVIADVLDRLERSGPNPSLPGRRAEETRHLLRMPSDEFRSYVRQRLDDLESRS